MPSTAGRVVCRDASPGRGAALMAASYLGPPEQLRSHPQQPSPIQQSLNVKGHTPQPHCGSSPQSLQATRPSLDDDGHTVIRQRGVGVAQAAYDGAFDELSSVGRTLRGVA
eukprot:Selendium_serpulae@DN426_c0_g1_i1.p2